MTGPKKSNVQRLLACNHIPYAAYTYATDLRPAVDVAQVLGILAHELYKVSSVLLPYSKPLLMIIPGPWELDLKGLAQALGIKMLHMATHRETEALTGLPVGGIAAEKR